MLGGADLDSPEECRERLAARIGREATPALRWIAEAGAEELLRSVLSDPRAISRLQRLVRHVPIAGGLGPINVCHLEDWLELGPRGPWVPTFAYEPGSPAENARRLADAFRAAAVSWALDGGFDLGFVLTRLVDQALRAVAREVAAEFDLLALGSYASEDLSLTSDVDLFLLAPEEASDRAFAQSGAFFETLRAMRAAGAPLRVDLHQETSLGAVVPGYEHFALRARQLTAWERHDLGKARLVVGREQAMDLVRLAAYREPIESEDVDRLLAAKRRYEAERVPPQFRMRQVKVGVGGLDDLEWTIQLLLLAYPTAVPEGGRVRFQDRIRALARARLMNAAEVEQAESAHRWLSEERHWLALHGFPEDTMPENPDKLARLAEVFGFDDGNALLRRYQQVQTVVRSLFEDTVARLRT